jgi:hypothetical protein
MEERDGAFRERGDATERMGEGGGAEKVSVEGGFLLFECAGGEGGDYAPDLVDYGMVSKTTDYMELPHHGHLPGSSIGRQ